MGEKDLVVIPSICDFTGLNMVTERGHRECLFLLCRDGKGRSLRAEKGEKPVVAVTLMGITNTGACAAIDYLEEHGVQAIGFHSTGAGGPIMEDLAGAGFIDGILDMSLHEITSGYFGGGFSYGPRSEIRLTQAVRNRVPLVVTPRGAGFRRLCTGRIP